MDRDDLRRLLEDVRTGVVSADEAAGALESLPFTDLDIAKVDHHRTLRCGFPEVIFCEGKTPNQVRKVAREILEQGDVVLGTRASASHYQSVAQHASDARYHEEPRLLVVDRRENPRSEGHILVATGGTADIPVAEEAAITAELMGNRVTRLFDVGVAGIHRLLANQDSLRSANVIIAVAGMEGALPSVIAGMVSSPVIAVPTSVGYGASFGGVAPLLTMLNSCASGVAVVNIDNGFGAAALASSINLAVARACGGSEPTEPVAEDGGE